MGEQHAGPAPVDHPGGTDNMAFLKRTLEAVRMRGDKMYETIDYLLLFRVFLPVSLEERKQFLPVHSLYLLP